jgi:acyl-CoA reductase-like NAD-dependent aldehyde dehydrogenase
MNDYVERIRAAGFTQTIDGEPVAAAFEDVIDPATGEAFQRGPVASPEDIDRAIAAARRAQPAWAALSWDEREDYIGQLTAVMDDNAPYLATLLTMEQGMTAAAALPAIVDAAASLRLLASVRIPDAVLVDDATRLVTQRWSPLGVVAAIGPWNYPVGLGFQKVANALIGGNTVVLKPSEFTPLTTLEIGRLARDVLPAGVLNVIGGGRAVGAALVAHPGIDKVSFTGSTATGVAIARQSSEFLRPVTLELGGNDAAILLPDGSVPALVAAIVDTALANRGQFCAAIKRVYVPSALHDDVCEQLVHAATVIRIGSGLDTEVDMGPIQNRAQFEKIRAFVDDARTAGGRILCGGAPLDRAGYFYPPTVIAGLSDGARIIDEEQFGPIIPVVAYDDLDTVIARINGGPYGLTGSIWTADLARGNEVAARLAVGTGWVNQHGAFDTALPFPQIKASGMGVDYADNGVRSAMRMQVIHALKQVA